MSVATRAALALLLLAVACDPAPASAPAPAAKVEEHNPNPSGDRKGLSSCLDDCRAQKLSATDEATCRNNCEVAFKVTPTAAGEPALEAAVSCFDRCRATSADDPACVDACKQAGQPAEDKFPGVLDRIGACVDACHADKSLAPTDRATCLRNCSQTARFEGAPAPSP